MKHVYLELIHVYLEQNVDLFYIYVQLKYS